MSDATPALIAAAAGVGFGHAILPDHWVPLAVVGRTRRYPLARVARVSSLAGIAHVTVSLLLGAVIIAIGLQFRSSIEHAQNAIVGGLLVATGVAFIGLELSGRGHGHARDHGHEHDHEHVHDPGHEHRHHDHDQPAAHRGRLLGLAGIMVPFGAAASPDLTILPVFLAAAAVSAGTAVVSLIAFALVTISTIVGLTVLATFGGYQVRGRWLERWGNVITAATLVAIGLLVVTGAI
jgi:nickel/cobalt transporter (NicO) family protein